MADAVDDRRREVQDHPGKMYPYYDVIYDQSRYLCADEYILRLEMELSQLRRVVLNRQRAMENFIQLFEMDGLNPLGVLSEYLVERRLKALENG